MPNVERPKMNQPPWYNEQWQEMKAPDFGENNPVKQSREFS